MFESSGFMKTILSSYWFNILGDAEEEEEEDLELNNPNASGFHSESTRATSSIQRNFAADGNDNSGPSHRARTVVCMSQHKGENIRPGKMVKTREFWILWMTFFLNTQSIGYINAMYKVRIYITVLWLNLISFDYKIFAIQSSSIQRI